MLFNYDRTNEESIYEYAKKLEKMTFREIIDDSIKEESFSLINNLLSSTFRTL